MLIEASVGSCNAPRLMGLLHGGVEGCDEFGERCGLQYLIDGFLAAKHFSGITQQIVLGLIVSCKNQYNQA